MKIIQNWLTENDCFKAGKYITPKGIMVHSTGANNPNLSRYVGPNKNNNDWNRPGLTVCVHAFIGKDANGDVQVVQTLPWNMRGWHCGGAANNTHISFEMCEDDLSDFVYMSEVRHKAVELCAFLCSLYNLDPLTSIISHREGHEFGLASNHRDPDNWWAMYFLDPMDSFRQEVADEMAVIDTLLSSNKTKERTPNKDEQWAIEHGLFEGYPDKTYRFGNPITRGELCTVLHRLVDSYKGGLI